MTKNNNIMKKGIILSLIISFIFSAESASAITSFSKSGSATSTNSAPCLTKIKSEINKGRAVLLGLVSLLGMGHTIIVYGYDNDSKNLHIFDPRDSRIICTYEELCNGTAITGYSCTQGAYYK